MASIAEASSLFEIDLELDGLLEEIEGQIESEGQAAEAWLLVQQFCEAHGEKVDRIGRFVRIMEARTVLRSESRGLLTERGRSRQVERTKNMVLYYLLSRTSEDRRLPVHVARAEEWPGSVRITDEAALRNVCRIEARIAASSGRQCFRCCRTNSQRL